MNLTGREMIDWGHSYGSIFFYFFLFFCYVFVKYWIISPLWFPQQFINWNHWKVWTVETWRGATRRQKTFGHLVSSLKIYWDIFFFSHVGFPSLSTNWQTDRWLGSDPDTILSSPTWWITDNIYRKIWVFWTAAAFHGFNGSHGPEISQYVLFLFA